MLSTAQDYRPGEEGAQQHIWQATLGPYAVVFVTNPGPHGRSQGPGYWSSNGRMPRNAQYRNVLISIYNIERHVVPGRLESRPYGYTHAYFPKWAFDEVIELRLCKLCLQIGKRTGIDGGRAGSIEIAALAAAGR